MQISAFLLQYVKQALSGTYTLIKSHSNRYGKTDFYEENASGLTMQEQCVVGVRLARESWVGFCQKAALTQSKLSVMLSIT